MGKEDWREWKVKERPYSPKARPWIPELSVIYQVMAREQRLERRKKEEQYLKREREEERANQSKVFSWVQKPKRKKERAQCCRERMKERVEGERNRAKREGAWKRKVSTRAECLKTGRVELKKS